MDIYSKEKRSSVMRCIKDSGNASTELKFLSVMKQYKLTGWRRNFPAYGRPDFVFPKEKIAVFVDGCFWHGCPKHKQIPETNTEYWRDKIRKNRQRDRRVTRVLRNSGWSVMRVWEHELTEKKIKRRMLMLEKLLERRGYRSKR